MAAGTANGSAVIVPFMVAVAGSSGLLVGRAVITSDPDRIIQRLQFSIRG